MERGWFEPDRLLHRRENDPHKYYFGGKGGRGRVKARYTIVDRVVALTERKGVQPAQIALSWLLHRPEVTAPIIGATKMVHLEEAVAALEIQLSAEDMIYLQELYQPHPVLEHS